MVQMLEERPPFVMFDTVSVEDREATIREGHYVGKDIDMVYITPAGSKDRIERVVTDWFEKLKDDLISERVPKLWVDFFKSSYEDYKQGKRSPTSGTSILDWPGLSPTLTKTLQSLHMLAIEDVAAMNEEGINRIGMGARALKQRAVDYLAAAKDVGKVAEEVSSLRAQLSDQITRNERLESKQELMARQLQALSTQPAPAGISMSSQISASDLLDDGPGSKL